MEITEIITRDRSSGEYHRRYLQTLEDGTHRTLVDERCQTDQSGSYDIVAAPRFVKGRRDLCKHCFRG